MGNFCSRPSTELEDQPTLSTSQTRMSVVEGQLEKNQILKESVPSVDEPRRALIVRKETRKNKFVRTISTRGSGKLLLARLVEKDRIRTELASLREEEASLPGRVEALKKNLSEVSKGNVRKVAEIRKLTSRISRLAREMERNAQGDMDKTNEEYDGREDPRAMFPEEIWVKFFDKLTDPQDLWNCYSTCTLFQRILRPWKSTWAFEQALPFLFPCISGRKLLRCRLVSKGWKDVLDNFLQEHPSHHPHDENTADARILTFVNPMTEKRLNRSSKFIFDERSLSNPLNFEDPEWSSKTHQSMALWRTAYLEVESFEDDQDEKSQELWRQVYQFLRIFGEHIDFLNFRVTGEVPSRQLSLWTKQQAFLFLVSDLFEMAPNLQKLSIENVPFIDAEEDLNDLMMDMEQLPLASRLKTLEVNFRVLGADPIIAVLLWEHHAQLGKLMMNDWTLRSLSHLEWTRLTELHLSVNNLEDLSSLARVDLPSLTKLGLRLTFMIFFENEGTGPLRKDLKFLDFLQTVSEVLVGTGVSTLMLGWFIHDYVRFMKSAEQESNAPAPTLLMPSTLKTLQLENLGGIIPHPDYQLLLPHFPHLENLNVLHRDAFVNDVHLWSRDILRGDFGQKPTELQIKEARLVREREVVEVNKFLYTGDMYKSNIWELLPQLEVFTFQWDVFTRGGYEEYCRRKTRSDEKKKRN